MENSKKYTFTCNDMPKRSFHFFEDMWKKKELCDITFRIENDFVHAHRIIITSAIPYLRDLLSNSDRQEEVEGISIPSIDPNAFKNLIEYSYTCKLEIDMENAMNILSAACYLRMDEIKEACCDFLAEHLNPGNIMNISDLARNLNCLELLTDVDCHVKQNFFEIVETEQFLMWPVAYLKQIIEANDLYVDSEQTVLEVAIKWVNICPEERKDEFPDLLRKIRLQEVDPLYLVDIVESEGFIEASPPIRNLIDEAKHYNLFPQKRKRICSFPTEPRQSMKTTQESYEEDKLRIYTLEVEETYTVQTFITAEEEWNVEGVSQCFAIGGSAAAKKNQMFFFYLGDVMQYDLVNNSWKYLFGIPEPSLFTAAVALKEEIYVLGGKTDSQDASRAARCSNPETKKWTLLEPMRTARWGASVVALSRYIFALGGQNEAFMFNSVERYDPEMGKWKTMRPMLTERCFSGAASVNGRIYVCGGIAVRTGIECIATSEMYDAMKNRWAFIKSMSSPARDFTLLPFRSKLYVIGGQDNVGKYLEEILIYHLETDEWTTGPLSAPEACGAVVMSTVID